MLHLPNRQPRGGDHRAVADRGGEFFGLREREPLALPGDEVNLRVLGADFTHIASAKWVDRAATVSISRRSGTRPRSAPHPRWTREPKWPLSVIR